MEVSMPMLVGIDVSGPDITIDAGTGRVGGDLLGGIQNALAQLQQQACLRQHTCHSCTRDSRRRAQLAGGGSTAAGRGRRRWSQAAAVPW